MKYIIIIGLVIFLTGCGSYELSNTCTKEVETGSLKTSEEYIIKYQNNDIYEVVVNVNYSSTNQNLLSSIKTDHSTSPDYIKQNREVLEDIESSYKVSYIIKDSSEDLLKQEFNYTDDKFEYFDYFEDNGFYCN